MIYDLYFLVGQIPPKRKNTRKLHTLVVRLWQRLQTSERYRVPVMTEMKIKLLMHDAEQLISVFIFLRWVIC